jgi:hypothetical protein
LEPFGATRSIDCSRRRWRRGSNPGCLLACVLTIARLNPSEEHLGHTGALHCSTLTQRPNAPRIALFAPRVIVRTKRSLRARSEGVRNLLSFIIKYMLCHVVKIRCVLAAFQRSLIATTCVIFCLVWKYLFNRVMIGNL